MYGGLHRNLRLWSVTANCSSELVARQDTQKQEYSKNVHLSIFLVAEEEGRWKFILVRIH